MKRSGASLLLTLFLLGFPAGGLLFPTPAAADVWCENSATKVLKSNDGAGKKAEVFVQAARNEWEGFQIVLKAGDKPMEGVALTMSDLAGTQEAVIPAKSAQFYLEYYVHIDIPSPCDIFFSPNCADYPEYNRTPGDYPDALVPFHDPYSDEETIPVAVPFNVGPDDLQTVFVDLHVPADAPAGEYSGEIAVTSGEETIHTIPVVLNVWDWEMPAKRSMGSAYGFSSGHLKKYHGGPEGPDAEMLDKLLRNYEFEVHRHRITYTTHNPGIAFEFDEEDNLEPVDFTAYDAYIGPRIDGSYYPDGAGMNRYNLGMFRPGHGTMGMTEEQFALAAQAMAEHLDEKGYLDHVYLYSLDEPWILEHWENGSYDKIRKTVELLNMHTDLWKGHVLITGPWQPALDECGDIWCPVTAMYGDVYWPPGSWPGPDKYKELLSQGHELWFYVCNANFPSLMGYDIDAKMGYEPRLTKWGAWYEGATGFLFWTMTYWLKNDPWHVLANYDQFGELMSRNGDGILIYPGDHNGTAGGAGSPEGVSIDGPVVSYRMKQIRDGFEDWEMFILASSLGAEEYVLEQVSTAYTAFGAPLLDEFDYENPPWTLDENVLFQARENVALKIQYLLNPDLYPDPEPQPEPETVETFPEPESDITPQPEVVEIVLQDAPTDSITVDRAAVAPDEEAGRKSSSGCSTGAPGGKAALLLFLIFLLAVLRLFGTAVTSSCA